MITPNLTNSDFNMLTKTEEALKPFVFNLAKGVEITIPTITATKPKTIESANSILYIVTYNKQNAQYNKLPEQHFFQLFWEAFKFFYEFVY